MKKKIILSVSGVALLAIIAAASLFFFRGWNAGRIKEGSVVRFEYTLSDEKGALIESSKGKEPLTYIHGKGQIVAGLEKELAGMTMNEEKNVRLKPEDAYGQVDRQAFQEIPRKEIPADALKVGNTLVARNDRGQLFPVRVHEIKDKTVVLDFNHPLAGKALTFAIKILDIKPPGAK
ncbi:MAG: peptidylprolyl isomerase [Deltaproteobacteria bacterium]|nr:peptidylprolyl isomerase [Deltaproteobacteria bacterium]